MNEFLSILRDVMLIATFQRHGGRLHAKRREEPTRPGRWSPLTDLHPFRVQDTEANGEARK